MFDVEKLNKLLAERKVTQRDFAAAIKASQPFVHCLLKGCKEPSLALAKRIADFFGILLDELVK